jgi:hypothetical protein
MRDETKDALILALLVFILPFMAMLGIGAAAILLKLLARSVL